MAPPSMPTIKVRCCTIALEPEMPVLKTVRSRISTTGSNSIAASGMTSRIVFSSASQAPAAGERRRLNRAKLVEVGERAAAHFGFPSPFERNSFSKPCASSNMSAGTILPRI